MYNGDNFYNQMYPQYNNGVYNIFNNNMYAPCKKNIKCLKHCNCCFSSEEENSNKESNYILTENNRKINNNNINNSLAINKFKIFNKFITDNSPYSNSQKILRDNEYRSSNGKLNNRYKQITRKNNENLFNHIYISLNPYERNTYSNSNDIGNISYNSFIKNSYLLKNNSDKIKKENYSVYGVNQINNNSNNESSFYYIRNNKITNNNYNKMFKNHKCQSQKYFNYDNQNGIINNLLYNDFTQNKIKSRVISQNNSEYPITYRSENCISMKPENNYKSEIHTKLEIYQRQKNNFVNNSKYYRNINNTELNKNENNHANKPFVNKNSNFKKIEYFNINNRLMKRNIKNENKRKINLVINSMDNIQKNYENLILKKAKEIKNIKKKNLADVLVFNNSIENNNHSIYEEKSYSKDTVIQIKQNNEKTKKNNIIINSVSKKKNEDDIKRKKNNENMLKIKLNTNNNYKSLNENKCIKEDKLKLMEKKVNLTELNSSIKNEGKILIIQKEKQKNTYNNNNKSEINNNKENINININFNKNTGKNILNNNNAFAHSYICKTETIKNEPKIKLNMDKNKLKFQNIKQIEKVCDKNQKNIINNKLLKKYDNFVVEQSKKKENCRQTSTSSIYIEKSKYKPIHIEKSNTNYISYMPSAKDKKISIKEVKKKKPKYSRQNMIQLINIVNKSFEEDFSFKYNIHMSKINKILKPQIAFRTSLFAKIKPEKEKYFIVNFFYSENIKKKPEIIESDF